MRLMMLYIILFQVKCECKRSSRRRETSISGRYEHLARNIDLSVLALVPSYKAFRDDLAQVITCILGHQNT